MTAARDRLAAILAEHILFGYGRCGCGAEFTRHGRYSADHRVHLADVLVAAGVRTAEQVAQIEAERDHERDRADSLNDEVVNCDRLDLLDQLAEARAAIAAVEALAEEWQRIGEDGLPHGGCLDMHRHHAKTLRAALAHPEGGSDADE